MKSDMSTVRNVIYHHYAKLMTAAILGISPGSIDHDVVKRQYWGRTPPSLKATAIADATSLNAPFDPSRLMPVGWRGCMNSNLNMGHVKGYLTAREWQLRRVAFVSFMLPMCKLIMVWRMEEQ